MELFPRRAQNWLVQSRRPLCASCLRQYLSTVSSPTAASLLTRTSTTRSRDIGHKFVEKGSTFRDHAVVSIEAGRGGDGCVSFLREKFLPRGPPNGGSGGHGGDVYIAAVAGINSLGALPARVRSAHGGHGRGSSMNGRKGDDTVLQVPVGTVVRELEPDDGWQDPSKYSIGPDADGKGIWVHYPRTEDDNVAGDRLKEAEKTLRRQYRSLLPRQPRRASGTPVKELQSFDLDEPTATESPILLCRGGFGGSGNAFFLSADNRSPKFASRGLLGERRRFALELKTIADVGLVGAPNAGKSTLLRAVSNARPKTADYAFTTLSPHLGTVSVAPAASQRSDSTPHAGARAAQGDAGRGAMARKLAHRALTPESAVFTVADIPGLVEGASDDRGLGHGFLRHVERAKVLCHVVDLSGGATDAASRSDGGGGGGGMGGETGASAETSPSTDTAVRTTGVDEAAAAGDPCHVYRLLRNELRLHQDGLQSRRCLVVANKADLPAARANLGRFRQCVAECALEDARSRAAALGGSSPIEDAASGSSRIGRPPAESEVDTPPIVVISARDKHGIDQLVDVMARLVQQARAAEHEAKALQAGGVDAMLTDAASGTFAGLKVVEN